MQIYGPLLIASNNRKTYEITMQGTMLSICIASSWVIGGWVDTIIVALCNEVNSGYFEATMIFLFYALAVLPFTLPAVDDFEEAFSVKKRSQSSASSGGNSSYLAQTHISSALGHNSSGQHLDIINESNYYRGRAKSYLSSAQSDASYYPESNQDRWRPQNMFN